MLKPVLLDTGVIYALLDQSEWAHEACVRAIESLNRQLVTCEPVIAESSYLLRRRPDAVDAILANVEAGFFSIPFQLSRCAGEVTGILWKYRDTPADFADACLIQMANELGTGDILTLDRHFRHYRWRRTRSFRMLIPLE